MNWQVQKLQENLNLVSTAKNEQPKIYALPRISLIPLDLPVFAFKFEEQGVPISGTSHEEYIFQKYFSWKYPNSNLQGSYLSPYGAAKFDKFRPDIFFEDTQTAFLYHGCYFHW